MERKDSKEELERQAIFQEEDAELTHEINQLAFDFEKKYQEVARGNKRFEDLYSGDFVYKEEPERLIIQSAKGKILSADYAEIFDRFVELVENDVKDEDPDIEIFKREPEPRTEYLRNFLKFNKGKPLIDLQTTRKLNTDEENTILLLTIDRYFRTEGPMVPFSETWTIRKMKFDSSADKSGGGGKAIKIKPRSMVRTMSVAGSSSK